MRRVPIRLKLAAALAVPLVALTTVTFLEVARTSDDVSDIREQTALARAAIGPSGLITTLQNERTWMSVEVVGWGDLASVPVVGYDETRAATDEAIAMLRDEIEREGGQIERAFSGALDGLDELEQIRADIDNYPGPADETSASFTGPTYDRYTALITPFFDAITDVSVSVDDPELRQGTELADAVAREIEVVGDTVAQILGDQIINGGIGLDGVAWVSAKQAEFERFGQRLQNATGNYADIVAELFPANLYADVNTHLSQAITSGSVDIGAVQTSVADRPDGEAFGELQEAIATELLDRSDALNASAVARQRWYAALGVLTLLLATVLTWLVSRSITKPLRSLTNQAKDMAEHRLPDAVLDILETPLGDDVAMPTIAPVRVNTRDEVADVADALNTVQDTALDLAVEQAVLRRNIADSFVNLGRRNQNLLGRQLDFITELETNEADPDTLANLFRLDHLATRMRRNAESLLVLAGIEPPRKWAAPVRLTDVIRAALGEVEDYQRVTVRGVEPATIMGSAAADLAHLLAELIENALVFSPPDQTVDIRGRNRPDGYTLAIIDSGLGMPTTDVTAANRRLAGAESFTIAPSKYLGHYVAGNLAARHNITVHLDNSPGNGITATIDIPPTLLTTEYAQPHADEPHAAREVWPPAPREVDAGDPAPPALAPPGPGRLPATHSYLPAAKSAYPPVDAPAAAGGALPPILERPAAPAAETPAAGGFGRPLAYPRAQFGAVPTAPASLPQAAPIPTNLAGGPPAPEPTPAAAMWQPPAPTVESPAAAARRTASGLVKRTPRVVDTGQVPAMRNEPTEDLLASLSRYTHGRESATGATPAVTGPTAHTGQTPASPPPLPSRSPGAGPSIPTRGDLGNTAPPLPTRGDPATPPGPGLPTRNPGAIPTRGDLGATAPPLPSRGDFGNGAPPLPTRSPGSGPAIPTRGDLGNGAPPLPTGGDPTAPPGPGLPTRNPGAGPAIPTRGDLGNGAPPLPTRGDLGATAPMPTGGDPTAPPGPGLPTRNPGAGPGIPTRGDLGNTAPPLPPRAPGSGIPTRGDLGATAPPFPTGPGLPTRNPGTNPGIPTRGDLGATAPPLPSAPAGPGGMAASGAGPGGPPPAWLTATPPPAPPTAPLPTTTGSHPTLGSMLAGLNQPGFTPRPSAPAPGGAPGGDPGVTSGGLTRRVRGAQMPATNPVAVRRPEPGPAPAPAPAAPLPPRSPQPTRSADAVYSFLTNFSAGVQRGLDETRPGR